MLMSHLYNLTLTAQAAVTQAQAQTGRWDEVALAIVFFAFMLAVLFWPNNPNQPKG